MIQVESYQKQLHESELREQATYKELEETRKNYDALLVTQLSDSSTKERLQSEVSLVLHIKNSQTHKDWSCNDSVKSRKIWIRKSMTWKCSTQSL